MTETWCPDTEELPCMNPQNPQEYPMCHDRSVVCPSLPLAEGMTANDLTNTGLHLGSTYVLNCSKEGYVLNVPPNYPKNVITKCEMPLNFYSNWTNKIWLEGLWSNTLGLNGCIDGTVCHSAPPEVGEHSGAISSSTETLLPAGSRVEYKCDIKSEILKTCWKLIFLVLGHHANFIDSS